MTHGSVVYSSGTWESKLGRYLRITHKRSELSGTLYGRILVSFIEYFLNNLHADTKPKAKYINWLLISVCVGLAVLLTTTMFLELVPKS